MDQFPAFLPIKGHPVIVVGGGNAALAKARLLLAADADVTIFAPAPDDHLAAEIGDRVLIVRREPWADDFKARAIVFVALEDAVIAEQICKVAKAAGAFVNVVDLPHLCDFTVPSIVDRGTVTIAISTGGAAPVLGRKIRSEIEALLPARIGQLAKFARHYRGQVGAFINQSRRKTFWESIFNGSVASQFLAGDEAGARSGILKQIKLFADDGSNDKKDGVVHIVGAGPGDPDLLTVKALRLLQSADIIFYDRLVSADILALARRDAERIYVGKAKANHAVPQSEIEARLIAAAREGKIVLRLKGGDPFIFGRGGEELAAIKDAGIRGFVTPGITAASGCAASVGMALTHRDYSQAVTFVTGHAKNNSTADVNWNALAQLNSTVVVYMGVGRAEELAENLMTYGRDGATPVAVIEKGTCADQLSVKGTLAQLPAMIARAGIKGPAVLVIGDVAALATISPTEMNDFIERNAA